MCGTGQPFTVAGTPLHWEVRDGSWTFTGNEIGFESFWDENGAQCITEHRLGPDLLARVLNACSLGPCPGSPGFPTTPWNSTALVKTAIPAP
jgi:ADYC domain